MKRLEISEMGALEEHVADQIAAVEESLTSVDEIFGNLDSLEYDAVVKSMSSLDRAKYDLTNLYAINSLFWMYMRSFGENPQNLGIREELNRIQKQMLRVKEITDKSKRPTINKEAAHRIIKHDLWQPGQGNSSSTSTNGTTTPADVENWENSEPMETDRGTKRKCEELPLDTKRGFSDTGFAPSSSSSDSSDSDE